MIFSFLGKDGVPQKIEKQKKTPQQGNCRHLSTESDLPLFSGIFPPPLGRRLSFFFG